ncbi:hypothetical protein ACFWVF_19650 [Streptomyces sp. NPDC058659]|uniref:hypothetical protein n=1 Tax=unclassified Streptomyces TaxID=2593676 RepID=UPI00365EB43A
MEGAAVAGHRAAAGGQAVLEGLADLVAQQRQDVGGVSVGEVGRGDFEHQLPDRVGAGGEVVNEGAQRGERGIRWWIGGREKRGDADVADGLADHGAHGGLIDGLEAAVGERGESVGDQLHDGVRTGGDGDQGALGQAVVERGRGGRAGVS